MHSTTYNNIFPKATFWQTFKAALVIAIILTFFIIGIISTGFWIIDIFLK